MESKKLELLFDKYWDGALSEQEELELRGLLESNRKSLDPEMRSLDDWFTSTNEILDAMKLDEQFDQDLLKRIEQTGKSGESWNWWKIAAAAVVIVALGLITIMLPQGGGQQVAVDSQNTQESPEKAYQEAKATLQLMSTVMNQGKQHLGSLEMINTAQQKVRDTFQPSNQKDKKQNQDS